MLAGRQTRINTDAETAVQVARFKDHDVAEILAAWQDAAPQFEQFVRARKAWPAVIDIASHEQDIRAAVGRPGARDAEVIWHSSDWLLTRLRPPGRPDRGGGGRGVPGGAAGRDTAAAGHRAGSRRSAGGWGDAAGHSPPPLTGPVTRPPSWTT